MYAHDLIFIAELIGIIAFAVSGVLVAIEHGLDAFGAVVLGTTTAVGGGMVRDITVGNTPPLVFTNPIYALLAVIVSLAVFFCAYFLGNRINLRSPHLMRVVNVFDAIGLAIFVTVGVDAALAGEMGDNPFLAIFLGTVTGVGGGVIRDLFAATVPAIFRKHIYASAAILGAAIYYFSAKAGAPILLSLLATVAAVVIIRMLAAHYRWNLPRIPLAKPADETPKAPPQA